MSLIFKCLVDSGPHSAFRTDTDISGKGKGGRERELQAWTPGPDGSGSGDDLTFAPPGAGNNSWDQFAVNEKLFGVKTNFDEDLYTTKLDRSAADFKERERKAQRIANEIIGVSGHASICGKLLLTGIIAVKGATSNPHIAEERNVNNVDDSGVNEEDK